MFTPFLVSLSLCLSSRTNIFGCLLISSSLSHFYFHSINSFPTSLNYCMYGVRGGRIVLFEISCSLPPWKSELSHCYGLWPTKIFVLLFYLYQLDQCDSPYPASSCAVWSVSFESTSLKIVFVDNSSCRTYIYAFV